MILVASIKFLPEASKSDAIPPTDQYFSWNIRLLVKPTTIRGFVILSGTVHHYFEINFMLFMRKEALYPF